MSNWVARRVLGGFVTLLIFVASVFGLGGGVTDLEAQTSTRPQIRSIEFEGNESFSDEELASAILTAETRCASVFFSPFCWADSDFSLDRRYLNPRTLRDDYVRLDLFYWQHGFRNAQVDTSITAIAPEEVEIRFGIEEGEPHRITSMTFLGLDDVEGPVSDRLPIAEGDPLDLVSLDAARDTLTRRLRNRGYAHADILRNIFVPAGTREAEVEFDVYTGPLARFGAISITGNDEVSESVINRMLPLREGGTYQREAIFDAQRNLYGLEIFQYATVVENLQNDPDSIVPLEVQVSEGNSHEVRTGGGWNTEECFNAEARWTSRNYMGGARRLVLRGRASNLLTNQFEESVCSAAGTGVYGRLDWLLSADFTQPFILSPRNSLAASVYAERQSLQNVFVRKAVGLNLGLTRSVGRSTPLTFYYQPQLARLDAGEVFFCTSFLVCNPVDINLLQATNVLAPIGVALTRDRTNLVVNPTAGYTARIELESARSWTGSDYGYERAVLEGTQYVGVREGWVIAGRIRGGWLRPTEFEGLSAASAEADRRIAHPEKRFYSGGSNSVRGYAQNQLGPKVVSIPVDRLVLAPAGGSVATAACLPEQIVDLTCDADALDDDQFFERPTGGTRVLEGNLELRFPLWGAVLRGAAFVDFGHVWNQNDGFGFDDLVYTPGLGLRYTTPIGPVRVDVAYKGTPDQTLPVVTSQLRPYDPELDSSSDRIGSGRPEDEVLNWVRAEDLALLGPRVILGDRSDQPWWTGLQLHFSIGQAF